MIVVSVLIRVRKFFSLTFSDAVCFVEGGIKVTMQPRCFAVAGCIFFVHLCTLCPFNHGVFFCSGEHYDDEEAADGAASPLGRRKVSRPIFSLVLSGT